MAEYQDDLALIIRYDGTKADFDNVKSNYKNKVVFIYGSKDAVDNQAGLVQAIWVGDSTGGRYLDMANVGAIKDGLTHIAGFAIDDVEQTITAGANGINFKGNNGIEIKLNPTTATNKDGVPYWSIEVDGGNLKTAIETAQAAAEAADDKAAGVSTTVNALIGNISSDRGKSIRTIAAEEAETVQDALLGADTNETNTDTIRGVKNVVTATNRVLFGKTAPVTGDKIITDALPDVIMGQLKFGGTIGNTQTSAQDQQQLVIKTSANYKSEFTAANSIDIDTNFDATTREGWYFIVAKPNADAIGNFGWNPITGPSGTFYREFYEVGDWFLSTGSEWVKIDNTDAVIMVAGMQGDITTASLVTELSTADDENPDPLAKKSDIKVDSVSAIAKLDGSTTKSYFLAGVGTTDKDISITADVKSMSNIAENTSANGFADARDVYDFIKARLSIKVVK